MTWPQMPIVPWLRNPEVENKLKRAGTGGPPGRVHERLGRHGGQL